MEAAAAAAAGFDNLCLLSLLSFRLSACESSLRRLILAEAVASLSARQLSLLPPLPELVMG